MGTKLTVYYLAGVAESHSSFQWVIEVMKCQKVREKRRKLEKREEKKSWERRKVAFFIVKCVTQNLDYLSIPEPSQIQGKGIKMSVRFVIKRKRQIN